jgi:hypothetical protein
MLPERTIRSQVDRLQKLCARFPEVEVREGQHHSFMVRGKKFAYHLVDHHGDGRVAFQCKAERGVNESLVARDAERFFLPPCMAHHGWLAMYFDVGPVPWDEVEAYLSDAYRLTAPKSLAREV